MRSVLARAQQHDSGDEREGDNAQDDDDREQGERRERAIIKAADRVPSGNSETARAAFAGSVLGAGLADQRDQRTERAAGAEGASRSEISP